ncbi:hypothetical protein GCM10022416_14250 [Actinomadura keratinilytica]|uniref:Uncharacterized protein n=1 Tax=Actinomadura keratinilytica TaxID=547461 RepID=A0ABP7YD34_9ACTN
MDEYVQVVSVLLELSRRWAFGTSRATVARGTVSHADGSEVIGRAVSCEGDADARDGAGEEGDADGASDGGVDAAAGSVAGPRSASGDDADAARSPSSPPDRTNTAPAASANAASATTTAKRRGRRPDGGSGVE